MNTSVVLMFLAGQFIIQLVLYYTLVRWIVNKPLCRLLNNSTLHKVLPGVMVVENLGISVIVMLFTAAGAAAGMSNLMASVLLGVIMTIDCKILLNNKQKQQKARQDEDLSEFFID